MYIEPCCVDRQLPSLLRQHVNYPVYFQTSGDITIARFMQAISSMVDAPFVLNLTVNEIDQATLQTIHYYFSRKWLSGLLLLTNADQSELVRQTIGDAYIANVQYACDPLIADGQCAFLGPLLTDNNGNSYRKDIILQGAMLTEKDFSLSLYSASFSVTDGKSDKSLWAQAVAPAISKLRIKPIITATGDDAIAGLEWK